MALDEEAQVQTEEQKEGKEFPEKVQEVLDKISGFTVLELAELVEAFQDKFNVSAAPMMAAGVAPGAQAAPQEEEEEEPTSFDVILKSFGENKIQVIKAVRSETSLALKEAKQVVEDCPSTIKEALPKEEAEKCAKALQEGGGRSGSQTAWLMCPSGFVCSNRSRIV